MQSHQEEPMKEMNGHPQVQNPWARMRLIVRRFIHVHG
jgi:hypothetical protein